VANIRVWWKRAAQQYTGNVYFRATNSYQATRPMTSRPSPRPTSTIPLGSQGHRIRRDHGNEHGRFQVWKNQAFGAAGEVPGEVGTTTAPTTPNASYYDNPAPGSDSVVIADMNRDGRMTWCWA